MRRDKKKKKKKRERERKKEKKVNTRGLPIFVQLRGDHVKS
jgi:hypothetical protein